VKTWLTCLLFAAAAVTTVVHAASRFTYQGALVGADGQPLDGQYDFEFELFAGAVSRGLVTSEDVDVDKGIFTVALDFGPEPFDGSALELEIRYRAQPESTGSTEYFTLSPRQPVTPAPLAINSDRLGGLAASSYLTGEADGDTQNELQDLSLSGSTLSLSRSSASVDLSGFADNTDNQALSLSGTNLRLTSDDGTDTVSLAGFLDNTDNQNLGSVLQNGGDAGNRDITNLDDVDVDRLRVDETFDCNSSTRDGCVDSEDIARDTISGEDIEDNIYILHIECNGSCADMSMRDACNVIENLRGIDYEVELLGVSCVHNIPSTTGNGFVACDDGVEVHADNECRAFNLRTLGDLPCVNGEGTDVMVTCLANQGQARVTAPGASKALEFPTERAGLDRDARESVPLTATGDAEGVLTSSRGFAGCQRQGEGYRCDFSERLDAAPTCSLSPQAPRVLASIEAATSDHVRFTFFGLSGGAAQSAGFQLVCHR
jgi:hypothetical protein